MCFNNKFYPQVGYAKDLDVFKEDSPFNRAMTVVGQTLGASVLDFFVSVRITAFETYVKNCLVFWG